MAFKQARGALPRLQKKKKNEMSNEGQTEKTKFINSVWMYETKEIEQEIEDLQIHFFT